MIRFCVDIGAMIDQQLGHGSINAQHAGKE
jgi:hypothetical protein